MCQLHKHFFEAGLGRLQLEQSPAALDRRAYQIVGGVRPRARMHAKQVGVDGIDGYAAGNAADVLR